ncbi:hypothetical protein AALP_AA6G128400 [Arabis alpina]|uniref:NB-ARC domain-containing protein n=1 Tax=Arabis alpina TaxID=50452 RepID=A0A087GNW4_ARAAL|nr:hypothetical protein AALP_AA6G128400 [Arabis alpina]
MYLSPGILEKRAQQKETTAEQDRPETNYALPEDIIYGFQNEIKSMKNFLLDQKVHKEFKSLVIVGEYGVGKTSLCKMIFNDKDVKSVYAPRIWVSMHSLEPGEDKKIYVLKRILMDLGVENEMLKSIHEEIEQEVATKKEKGETDTETATEKEISALLYALRLNLRWKKYLIVFDDVREEDEWNEILDDDEKKVKEDEKWGKYLSDGFPKGSGGRVIYTTREESLAMKLVAEEHEIHRLWPLTDTKSIWDIYAAALQENKQKEPPRNDKKCLDELMNKSRGLPLAIKLMATLLPVFLDSEKAAEDGSANGGTDSANDPLASEENRNTSPLRTSED